MSTIPSFTHPGFCDPRVCKPHLYEDGDVSYEHRSSGMTWKPAAQPDMQITADVSQLAEQSRYPSVGDVNVTLRLVELGSLMPGSEREIAADVDLDPHDARMLAAQLVVLAEQAETIRRQTERGAA